MEERIFELGFTERTELTSILGRRNSMMSKGIKELVMFLT